MRQLTITIHSSATDQTLLMDVTRRAKNVIFTTTDHGFGELSAFVAFPRLSDQFFLYDRPGLPHVVVSEAGGVVWEGRLEDVAVVQGGIRIGAFGYWRSLTDAPYTALWSSTDVSRFLPVNDVQYSARKPDRYEMDTNNRVRIALSKNATYNNGADVGMMIGYSPYLGERDLVAVSFDYTMLLPTNWQAQCNAINEGFTSELGVWAVASSGALESGSVSQTFSARDHIAFQVYNATGSAATYAGESGDNYLRITNLRVKTTTSSTVTASTIAQGLVSFVSGLNASQLSSATGLIQDPGLDFYDEVYEDETPADILTRITARGDNATNPHQWEVGVYEGRLLHLRPRASAGRAWYVDATRLEAERTLDSLANSAYALYQEPNGRVLRTSTTSDTASIARYGLTRRATVDAETTGSSQAEDVRDAFLQDGKDPPVRAALVFTQVYDASGARYPLWAVRAGDTMTIRNLPPTASTSIDRIRTFRVAHTSYRADNNTLTVEPDFYTQRKSATPTPTEAPPRLPSQPAF